MEDYISFSEIAPGRTVHIGSLSRQTIISCEAEHLGFDGYFVFEIDDSKEVGNISVLAKAASLEGAFRLADLWRARHAA